MTRMETVRCTGPFTSVVVLLLSLSFAALGIVAVMSGEAIPTLVGIVSLCVAVIVWRGVLVVGFGRVFRNPSFGAPIRADHVQSVHIDHDTVRVATSDGLQQVALVKGVSMDPVERAHRVAEAIARVAGETRKIDVVVGEPHQASEPTPA